MKRGSEQNTDQPSKRPKTLSSMEKSAVLSTALIELGDPLVHIFSHLNVEDISTVNVVCKDFYSLAQNRLLWQSLIEKYFPHLPQLQTEKYQLEPRQLFLQGYLDCKEHFTKYYQQDAHPFIFTSLLGNVEKISQSNLADHTKRMCYILAASNGHFDAFEKLKEFKNSLKINFGVLVKCADETLLFTACIHVPEYAPIRIAASHANINVVEAIFSQRKNLFPKATDQEIVVNAVDGAFDGNHPHIILYLLDKYSHLLENEELQNILTSAVTAGYEEVVKKLSTLEIDDERKQALLSLASEHGHLDIVSRVFSPLYQTLNNASNAENEDPTPEERVEAKLQHRFS